MYSDTDSIYINDINNNINDIIKTGDKLGEFTREEVFNEINITKAKGYTLFNNGEVLKSRIAGINKHDKRYLTSHAFLSLGSSESNLPLTIEAGTLSRKNTKNGIVLIRHDTKQNKGKN